MAKDDITEEEKLEKSEEQPEDDKSKEAKSDVDKTVEESESDKPKKSNKVLFIIVGSIVLICGLVAAVFLTPLGEMIMGADSPVEDERQIAEEEIKAITYLPISELTINLKKTSGRSRTLTASFVLALHNEDMRKNVNNFVPLIEDQFNTFLREMEVSDLEGIAGIERVSQEMLIRINRVVAPFSVKDVLVQKFYIK